MFESLLTGNAGRADHRPTACWPRTWRWRPTALSATFRLRPKARFHNGDPVLAADVKHTYDTLIGQLAAPAVPDASRRREGRRRCSTSAPCASTSRAPNRELPLIVGGMPVFSRNGAWERQGQALRPGRRSTCRSAAAPTRSDRCASASDITYVRDPNYWGARPPGAHAASTTSTASPSRSTRTTRRASKA